MSDLKAVSTHGYWDDLNIDNDDMLLVGTFGWFPQDIVTYLGTDFVFLFSTITTRVDLTATLGQNSLNLIATLL